MSSHRYFHSLACVFIALICIACGGGKIIEENVNLPVDRSIGVRIGDYERVVKHFKSLDSGIRYASDLPAELQIKNLMVVYNGKDRYCALEYPSHPIDSNPIFVFIDEKIDDPDKEYLSICKEHSWHTSDKLKEPRWYLAFGQ